MMKWILGLLVVINLVFFAVMRWGGSLTVDAGSPPLQASYNADKINVLALSAASSPVAASAVVASAVVAAMSSTPQVTTPAVKPVKLSCMEWGEFSGADLPRVEKALASLKLGDKLKQRHVEHVSGYWVYIAPMKTHVQVEQKVAQLKERGVEDYFVIQEPGAWQNAISLGVFKTEEAAKKYLTKLQGQGVKTATVGERSSKQGSTVLLLRNLGGTLPSQLLTLQKSFPDSELKRVPCN